MKLPFCILIILHTCLKYQNCDTIVIVVHFILIHFLLSENHESNFIAILKTKSVIAILSSYKANCQLRFTLIMTRECIVLFFNICQ